MMEYRPLGRTGVKVSPLCLGTMNFGYRTPEDESVRMIHHALDEGINFVDTANFYGRPARGGHGQGITEAIVGRALDGRRDRVVLATKATLPMNFDDPNARGGSRRHLIAECEASLRRLGTEYIDLYQLHRPDPSLEIDESLRALDDLVRSGKVRYIGTSMFAAWQIMEGLAVSERLRLNRFVTEQPRYNILDRRIERELVPFALAHAVALLPYAPLQGGVLTGKYQASSDSPGDSRMADEFWGEWAAGHVGPRVFDTVEQIGAIAAERDWPMSRLAIAWVVGRPAVASTIIGPRTMAQLEDNLAALELEPDEEALAAIDRLAPSGELVSG